ILASFRHATGAVLGATPSDDVLRAGIGLTLEQQARDLAGDRAQELFDVYVEHNRASHAELLRMFDGVPEMIVRLRRRGARLGGGWQGQRPGPQGSGVRPGGRGGGPVPGGWPQGRTPIPTSRTPIR